MISNHLNDIHEHRHVEGSTRTGVPTGHMACSRKISRSDGTRQWRTSTTGYAAPTRTGCTPTEVRTIVGHVWCILRTDVTLNPACPYRTVSPRHTAAVAPTLYRATGGCRLQPKHRLLRPRWSMRPLPRPRQVARRHPPRPACGSRDHHLRAKERARNPRRRRIFRRRTPCVTLPRASLRPARLKALLFRRKTIISFSGMCKPLARG